MQETLETRVRSLDWEDPLEKEVATPSSILAWEIPWTEEPNGLYNPQDRKRVRHDLATKQPQQILRHTENNCNLLSFIWYKCVFSLASI